MKQLAYTLVALTTLTFSTLHAQGPNRIAQELLLKQQESSLLAQQEISLFDRVRDDQTSARAATGLQRYLLADLSTASLQLAQRSVEEVITLVIPYYDKDLVLELYRVDDSPALVRTSGGSVTYELGQHYRGILRGDLNSLATVSFYDSEVVGLISSNEHGNIVVGEWKEENAHIIYNDRDVVDKPTFECEVRNAPGQLNEIRESVDSHSRSAAAGCTDIYLEIGYDVYTNKGSSQSSVQSLIGGIFNQVKTIYANEGIDIKMSEMFIWTSSDPYSGSASKHLDQFMDERPSYNGDLAHLITLDNGNGGIAYVDVLCSSNFSYGYSDISGGYSNYPTYSWSVNVLAHELGHNFGSDHTHACVWGSGKDKALDDCYGTEGSCGAGPTPSNGGTIMSYCHLSSTGVNFSNGFGTEPGNRIRSRVNAASCLGSCGGGGGGTTCNLSITGFDVDEASCGQENGQVQINVSGATSSTTYTLDGESSNSNTFSGLAAGTYTVLVANSSSCQRESEITVGSADGSVSLTAEIEDETCGQSNGEVKLRGSGGDSPYQYTLGSKTQSGRTFSGLDAGTYMASVVDDQGCIASISVTIEDASGPSLGSNIDHTSCGEQNGRVELTAAGGSGSFTYTLDNQSNSTGVFDDLESGTYTAEVTDGSECSTSKSLVVKSSEAILTEVEVTATECGEDNGKLEISADGGEGSLRYSIGGSFQSNPVFTGLSAGEYEVRVRDQASCETESMEEVESSQSYSASLDQTDTYCGEENGSLVIKISEGSGPFSFKINDGAFSQQNEYEDLKSGNYRVTVRDETGCETELTAAIKTSRAIDSEVTVIHTTCGEENGRLSIDADGGVGALDIKINGTSRAARNFAELAHGNYVVQISDKVGCVVDHQATIEPSQPVALETSVDATTCDQDNGTIQLEATGSEGPYQYRIDNKGYSEASTFIDLTAGAHTVSVRDDRGCEVTTTVTVEASEDAQLDVVVQHTKCAVSNGALEVDAKGGTAPFVYLLNGQEVTPANMQNLAPGDYEVLLRDAVGCEGTATVSVEPSEDIEIQATAIGTTCGEKNGQINTEIVTGKAPFIYRLDDIEVAAEVKAVAAGPHLLEVVDADGCSDSQDIDVAASNGIDLQVGSSETTCGVDNGEIEITASGGTGSLLYAIDGEFTDQILYSTLAPRTYVVQVKDDVGCLVEHEVAINPSTNPQAKLVAENTRCGEDNGSIRIDIQDGVAPFTIQVNGQTSEAESLQDLAPGDYDVVVVDVHGCETSATTQLAVSSAPSFSATTVAADCYQANGELIVDANDGIAPYHYSIGEGYQATERFEEIDSGTYVVTVLDSDDCAVEQEVTVDYDPQFVAPELPAEASLCDGDAVTLSSGLSDGNVVVWSLEGDVLASTDVDLNVKDPGEYQVTITYDDGCVLDAVSKVEVHEKPSQTLPAAASLCHGEIFTIDRQSEQDSYVWSHGAEGQEVLFQTTGVYKLTTTNEHSCSTESQIDIEVVQPVELSQPTNSEEYGCAGSWVKLSSSGAANYAWFEENESQPFADQREIEIMLDSSVALKLVGTNRCFADTAFIVLKAWQDESALSDDTTVVEGAPLSIKLQGGNDIAWASQYDLSCSDCEVTDLRPTEAGTIYVDYLDDNGCERSGEVEVDIVSLDEALPDLVNVITPNQDGYNDGLRFEGTEYLRSISLRVFDQQGQEIYVNESYENDWEGIWDGRLLAEGVYFYIVAFSLDDRVFEFDSPLTVVRSEIR